MSTANKLTYLNDTKTKLKNVINYAGANITNDTFRSYPEKLYNEFVDFVTNGTDSLYNSLPKVTGEDTELTLNNTANGVLKLDFKGNTSQDGEPTPSNPQQIHVVTGDNDVKIENRNLAQHINGYITASGVFKVDTDDSFYFPVTQGETYIYNTSGNRDRAAIFNSIPTNNQTCIEKTSTYLAKNTPFVASATGYMVIFANTPTSETVKNDFIVVKGNTIENYTPHQEQTYQISLGSLELCKIGNYQDYIYKSEGNWYKYGAVGKVVLDGSENITYNSGSSWKFRYTIQDANFTNASNEKATLLSNYFDAGIWNNSQNNQIATTLSSPKLIGIRYDNITSLADFKTWLSTHNTTLYYALETPTYTLLDDTLQEQLDEIYYNAVSYEDQTNISQTNADLPFVIGASAIKKYSE